jgi:hypothetical protein
VPTASLPKALTGLRANAKKDSLRATIAAHLTSNLVAPAEPLSFPPKAKTPPKNPYLDLWAWSCHELEWAGPVATTEKTLHAHHILPVLYHHFGCVPPTQTALALIRQLATPSPSSSPANNGTTTSSSTKKPSASAPKLPPKPIIEIGSGTGYWTYMLRRAYPELAVTAVDSGLSAYRTLWIGDTVRADGPAFLAQQTQPAGGQGAVLLLVYPSTGEDFTGKVLRAFQGDAVVVAGTQNRGGFTGFKGETVAEWVERERKDWREVCRVPLPSFAGKDEALFVFVRREEGGEGEGESAKEAEEK